MTEERLTILTADYSAEYAAEFLVVKDKSAHLVPFVFNKPQQKIHAIYLAALKTGKPIRIINLKARQEGCSTYWQAVLFHRTTTNCNRKAKTVAHAMEAASNLFEMANRFYNNLIPQIKPKIEHSNERKLSFGELGSSMKIGSADVGETLSRSDTINDLHLTEVCFWRVAKAGLNALLHTVPDLPGTLVVLESTANGIGGEFFDIWQAAKAGENDFIPIFLAWFEDDSYALPFSSPSDKKEFEKHLSDEELDMRKMYKLSLEQLNWRRWTIRNKCGSDARIFRQEYPSNDVEAFLASGRPVFDIEQVDHLIKLAEGPEKVGYLVYANKAKSKVQFVENPSGFIKLFDDPQVLLKRGTVFRYAAGCDVAEGLAQGDYSSIRVLDRKRMRVCVDFHGHLHPDLLAVEQHKINLFLNSDVWFCTERNNHGLATVIQADKLGLRQYYESKWEAGYEATTDSLGFKTTVSTKPRLIEGLLVAVRDERYIDDCKDALGEFMTFVYNARGGMSAQDKDKDPSVKCFDDRVISSALMWEAHLWLPKIKSTIPVKKDLPWFKVLEEANNPKSHRKSWKDVVV